MKRWPVVEILMGVGVAVVIYLGVKGFNVMPVVLLAGLAFMLSQTAGIKHMGAKKVTAGATASVPGVKFDDIGGQTAAKKELLEAIEFIMNRDEIRRMGIRPLKGVLLTGPPGTGKTLLAKAAAHHTGSVFLAAAGSDFVEMYAGVGAQRVRDLFRKAREVARREKKSSAVIFIDEIDVLGARRGSHASHMEYDQTLNHFRVSRTVDDCRKAPIAYCDRFSGAWVSVPTGKKEPQLARELGFLLLFRAVLSLRRMSTAAPPGVAKLAISHLGMQSR